MTDSPTTRTRRFVANRSQLAAYLLFAFFIGFLFWQGENEERARIADVVDSYCSGQQERLDLIRDVVVLANEGITPPVYERIDLSALPPEVQMAVVDIFQALEQGSSENKAKILERIEQADTCPGTPDVTNPNIPTTTTTER